MAPMVGPQTMVVPIQNGVTSHETVDAALGAGHATGGTVFISASLAEPGVVASRGKVDRLVFGEISVAAALGIAVAEDTDQKGLAFNRSVAYDTGVSMLEDIESGKPTELPWLSGRLVREAARLGVAVPLHAVAQACLSPYAQGRSAARQ